MASLSRELARWVSALRYEDLPPAVVDRAKGVTLHCLASVLVGAQTAAGRQAIKLITDEESGVKQGATILVDGAKVTKGGAAFANSEMGFAGGKGTPSACSRIPAPASFRARWSRRRSPAPRARISSPAWWQAMKSPSA
jgi:hypothetical protein